MNIEILAKLFLFFILCAFLGWLVEELWVGFKSKKVVNRGFIIGPLCPIYGFGSLFIVLISRPFLANPVLIFLFSALGCAAIEYFTSFLLEKLFGARWWNYTDHRFNLHGRICLDYVLVFGLGGLLIAYILYPGFLHLVSFIPLQVLYIVCIILAILFVTDHIVSFIIIKGFKKIRKSAPQDDSEDITAYVHQVLAERGRLYRRLNNFDFVIGRAKVLHYKTDQDDLVENKGQQYRLPTDYKWIRRRTRPILFFFGRIWARLHRLFTGTKYVNRKILDLSQPCFIYANHTQPVGDILAPVDYCSGHRLRLLASPANLGIPIIGHFLPDLGALPVPDNIHQLAKLNTAIMYYAKIKQPIIIYPEAHVWPYYTKIRPFSSASLTYPVKAGAAVYTAVTTYQKRRFTKKPRRTIYFSGPFYPDTTLPHREQTKQLHAQVFAAMEKSARHNNIKYVKYIHDS